MQVQEQNVEMEVKSSKLIYMGDVMFEQLMDEYDKKQSANVEKSESPYDTESEIKVVKRFQPTQTDDEDHITFLGPVYDNMDQRVDEQANFDRHLMPNDEVESISGFEATDSKEKGTKNTETKINLTQSEEATANNILDEMSNLKASVDKPSDPLGHLRAEISSLSNKVDNLESFLAENVSRKLEEMVLMCPCLEVGWIRRIQVLDTAYWGFLGVGTTLDIFQNIILIPYLEYGVLSLSGYGVLSFILLWSLVSAGTDTPYLP
ncbi:hypothetical protein Tco_0730487 [Tanacetum coccineum]|uniref:Uncharacterized protein n=1 Tax=Tanacetum coccineum TaxID=301880 RepID=A0ABQ4YT38_9ASTR